MNKCHIWQTEGGGFLFFHKADVTRTNAQITSTLFLLNKLFHVFGFAKISEKILSVRDLDFVWLIRAGQVHRVCC